MTRTHLQSGPPKHRSLPLGSVGRGLWSAVLCPTICGRWVPYERAASCTEDVDCVACTRVLVRRHLAKNAQPPTK